MATMEHMMETISLTISMSDSEEFVLWISPLAVVGELKDLVRKHLTSRKTGDMTDGDQLDLHVVFAGNVLADNRSLGDCLVRESTTLHVISRPKLASTSANSTSITYSFTWLEQDAANANQEPTVDDLISAEKATMLRCSFYGYCKEQCYDVTPALLRFVCDICGGARIVVDRLKPISTWETIVSRGKIPGTCFGACGNHRTEAKLIFKCASHLSKLPGNVVYLNQFRLNQEDYPCVTCGDVRSPNLEFPCDLSHVLCLACFKEYCSVLISERRFTWLGKTGYTVRCPYGCHEGYVADPHHFYVLGNTLYEKYKQYAAEECFVRQGGVFCPHPFCDAAFVYESEESESIAVCPVGHRFCRYCYGADHYGPCDKSALPVTGSVFPNDHSKSIPATVVADAKSRRTIANTTKACPGCRAPVERSGGCMHMICWRCSNEFCWICLTDWGIDCMSRHWF